MNSHHEEEFTLLFCVYWLHPIYQAKGAEKKGGRFGANVSHKNNIKETEKLAALFAVVFRTERIDNIKYSPEMKLRCVTNAAYCFEETENRQFTSRVFVRDTRKT